MNFVKVTGTNFVRDINSMGLSNTDTAAKDEYYNKVRLLMNQKEQINMMNKEISEVKSDIVEIKKLLQQLIVKQ
jgi:hypothetical protein